MLRRRQFSLGSALSAIAAWAPVNAQRPHARVGYGGSADPKDYPRAQLRVDAFLAEMARLGWREGANITYLRRFVGDSADKCRSIAQEFVAEQVDLIVATYNEMAECALAATASRPIVAYMADAVELGYIRSLARPGGNLTGVVEISQSLTAKRLQILRQAVPRARQIAYLTVYDTTLPLAREAAGTLGIELVPVLANKAGELARAIAGTKAIGDILGAPQIVTLVAKHRTLR